MNTYRLLSTDYIYRTATSAVFATLATFALLTLMLLLIRHDYEDETRVSRPMPQVIMPKDTEIKVLIEDVLPPDSVEPPPTAAPAPQEFAIGPTAGPVQFDPVGPATAEPTLTALPPGEPIPYLRSQPIYPRTAANRGISGYVDVMFTINVMGATEDVQVIGAEPANVFDRAALRAVKKWKYRPQIADNGEAVRKAGVTTRVRFQIEE
ncbi:MAG: energy transducer TonB [Pseudomonadales bacterium]